MSAPPPRIFIITATQADAAIVFRRGPADWFHLLKWNLADDSFEPGSWFRGTVYQEKCDLSPDGALLLYFVHQGNKAHTSYSSAWTGLGRAPWLTALGLWPQGTTYGGGGRFVTDRHVVIRTGDVTPHEDHPATGYRVESGNPPMHASSDEVEGAAWSGRDRHGTLIFAKGGKIFRRAGNGEDVEVKDLAGMKPDPQPPAGK